MAYQVVSVPKGFKIKNLETGKLSKNTYQNKKNANIQIQNRLKFRRKLKGKSSNN
jgi:hypothetical protein